MGLAATGKLGRLIGAQLTLSKTIWFGRERSHSVHMGWRWRAALTVLSKAFAVGTEAWRIGGAERAPARPNSAAAPSAPESSARASWLLAGCSASFLVLACRLATSLAGQREYS